MAVEDGAVLGRLLGLVDKRNATASSPDCHQSIPIADVLRLYESLRKVRTSVNVKGALSNQHWYQLPDGPEQEARDAALATVNWTDSTEWHLTDPEYQREMLGTDTVAEAEKAFAQLVEGRC